MEIKALAAIAKTMDDHRRAERRMARKKPIRCVFKYASGLFGTKAEGLLTAHESASGRYWVNINEPVRMSPVEVEALKRIERKRKALFRSEQRLLEKAHRYGQKVTLEEGLAITREREGK